MTSRESFELAMRKHGAGQSSERSMDDGRYRSLSMQTAWVAWREAERQAAAKISAHEQWITAHATEGLTEIDPIDIVYSRSDLLGILHNLAADIGGSDE